MRIASLFIGLSLFQVIHNQALDKNKDRKTIVILLHLYNLNLMDEFILKINRFIKLNGMYDFYIKINIPVAKNIEEFNKFNSSTNDTKLELIYKFCLASTPYHQEILTQYNCYILYSIARYLWQRLNIPANNIQIIFSENRGVDIGGFFLLLDQLIKSNLKHDYIVKLHTKSNMKWRNKLLAILNLNLKKYLHKFDCIYAFKKNCSDENGIEIASRLLLKKILQYYNFPEKEKFEYAAGTMFIASSKVTEFFKKYDRIDLFNQLNLGYNKKSGLIEHGYERFFGYLIEFLKLRTYVI